ncbi:hypothetical protein K3148_03685 [Qipengyuania aurantiaca]|uniref:Uncharacterized protein n=1 Tax=Qipengyuania aurantiaca TaxID=2867233 RepID=A0ABX8ZNB5_9SPHN|nr:hypothetical protein [Qipengyuania aurantiaca]QZD90506.1 hypothetical protein K3148_03685 [Qipengyuania aurantiaca]
MDTAFSRTARLCAALVSLIAIVSLMVQSVGNLERDGTMLAAWSAMLQWFTIWGNVAASSAGSRFAVGSSRAFLSRLPQR